MITIKRLETDDEIRGKAYVHCHAWKEAYVGLIDQSFLDARTVEMSQERAFYAFHKNISTLVAKDGDNVIGFTDFGKYRWDDLKDAGEVYAIYVLKEFYGKGIGHSLMEKALQNLKEYKQVAVWVLEGNERAIRFYRKFGFEFDGGKMTTTLGTETTELRMIMKSVRRSGTDVIKEENRFLSEYTYEDYLKDFELDYLGFDGVINWTGEVVTD